MKVIYKYALNLEDYQIVYLPIGATILSVGLQDNMPVLWALHERDQKPIETRRLLIYPTGQAIERDFSNLKYIATLQRTDGIVLHLFEMTDKI